MICSASAFLGNVVSSISSENRPSGKAIVELSPLNLSTVESSKEIKVPWGLRRTAFSPPAFESSDPEYSEF